MTVATATLERLAAYRLAPAAILDGLLDACTDDDHWDDTYHGALASAGRQHLENHPQLLPELLSRLKEALDEQKWPPRRAALAFVAACVEVMPAAVQRERTIDLEGLLVRATADADSFTARRQGLTTLSYLRLVSPRVALALLAGCQDIAIVQRDAVAAAGRFQRVAGDPLPHLVPALTGESASTAYAVARLLGALGASAAGEAAGLRGRIIEVLVGALKEPASQQEVFLDEREGGEPVAKGKLEDALYEALLQVAGWPV